MTGGDPGDDELAPLGAEPGGEGGEPGDAGAPIVVIGAGVIGLATALTLVRSGHRVLVIERERLAAGASRGNAGAFAFSDVLPLASPGIVRQLPRWLLDPLGPLALRPRYLPQIAPWLWRFWRASRPARVARSTEVQAALMRLSQACTPALLRAAGAAQMVHADGNLHLYDDAARWRASLPGWAVRARHGIAFEHLKGAAPLAALQPGLSPAFEHGTFVPGWQTIDDPLRLLRAMAQALRAAGGRLARADVVALQSCERGARVVLAGGGSVDAAHAIVAAGAWSHRLAATLGERIPLEAERGYNTTLPAGAFELRCQLTFADHGFVVTPIGGGVRVGGAVEFAGLDAAPDYRRSAALLTKARRFLPGLRADGGTRWMGCRPSLPDSLPVVGRARTCARVVYAFGHGHLGLTQAAATAELVAALVENRAPALDLHALRPGRFG